MREEIIAASRRLYEKNLLAGCDGNISIRLSDKEILITPSGRPKWSIRPQDIARITIDNEVLSGNPSSEMLMHTAVYRKCPDARTIVHAHPPNAIAWTIAEPELKELPSEMLSELILACGAIPIALYARPGTKMMGEVLEPYLPDHKAIILARHGAITWGGSLEEACNGMERIEHTAYILLQARKLGPLTSLPEEEIIALRAMRKNLGNRLL